MVVKGRQAQFGCCVTLECAENFMAGREKISVTNCMQIDLFYAFGGVRSVDLHVALKCMK